MLFNPVNDNRWLYDVVDGYLNAMHPVSDKAHDMAKQLIRISDGLNLPIKVPHMNDELMSKMFKHQKYFIRGMAGSLYVSHMFLDTYHKPEFGINGIRIDDEYYDITEEVIKKRNFCNLLHFKKLHYNKDLPKMLLIAPMSGHYATLLRGTVTDMLPFYDVYITDWKNARDVPLSEGAFDFNDFVQYLITFMTHLGPDLHVTAVCQPTVPALVATAIMANSEEPSVPKSLTLIGGPVDTNEQPTAVNDLATNRSDEWFKQNAISIVPARYPGHMRLVYPGFMQLSGFMSMNLERHMQSLASAVKHYAEGDRVNALKTIKFYSEYLATMDLTAEFYMQTMNTVFQEKLFLQGRIKLRGKYARLSDIKQTAILAIEGGKDDITGVGQTKSALTLCKSVPDDMKHYYLAEDVGHYGLFNGSKFRKAILPEIRKFTSSLKPSVH
jgi:poly(3-hydroxybutyrate) depolymerase